MGAALLVAACGGDPAAAGPAAGAGGQGAGGAAGGCAPGTLARDDGTCMAAGIDPADCAPGFVSDGDAGCAPVLPDAPCPEGEMAVPGETTCRPVAPCGAGKWGDIPVEPDTEYVDAAYAGPTSDGSEAMPWKTVVAAVAAAAPGAIVAIAPGTYPVKIEIQNKPVRLWGKCPGEVELATDGDVTVLVLGAGADGTELHDLAVTSTTDGIGVSGSMQVVLDRIWLHDTTGQGINAQNAFGETELALRRSLVERTHSAAFLIRAIDVTIEESVLRDTQAAPNGSFGDAVAVRHDASGPTPARVSVRSSVIERSRDAGITIEASEVTVDATVIRDTEPEASSADFGFGITTSDGTGLRASVAVRGSVLERNHAAAIFLTGADATVETTTIRDTLPLAASGAGRGIEVAPSASGEPARATVRSTLVERSVGCGVLVSGGDATLEATLVRDTQAALDGNFGRGVQVQPHKLEGQATTGRVGSLAMRGCAVERSVDVGLSIVSAGATIDGTLVRDVAARADGLQGDGISVFADVGPASVVVQGSRIESAARAGFASFGGSMSIGTTTLSCNPIALDGEEYGGQPYAFEDLGGNACVCDGVEEVCSVQSASLTPPDSLLL